MSIPHPFCNCGDSPCPPPGPGPTPGPGTVALDGDVTGPSNNNVVEKIQGVEVSTGGNPGDVMTLDVDGKLKLLPVVAPPPPQTPDASDIAYNNTGSGLVADDVQEAIDEVVTMIPSDADEIAYDNTTSGLSATDVQDAIDELAARPPGGGDTFVLASETIELPTSSSPEDVLVYTVPACIDATVTFVLLSVEEQLQGAGTVTVRVGTTAGDDDLIIDSVVDSTTLKGNFAGKDISTLGTIWPASSGYVWNAAEGDEIHVQVTTSGSITGGKLKVYVLGVVLS